MKLHYLITIILSLCTSVCIGQKITKNEVDEFEGIRIVETSWEWIKKSGLGHNGQSFFRLRKVGDQVYFDYKKALSPVSSVNIGEIYKIIDKDGTVYTLENTEYQVATQGAARKGAYNMDKVGYQLSMIIPEDLIAALRAGKQLSKARLITTDGHAEEKWGKGPTKKLLKCVQLFGM